MTEMNQEKIELLLKQMTIEEKLSLLEGSDMGFTVPIDRLGIPKILMVDGPHGVRVVKGAHAVSGQPYTMNGEMEEATAFPCEAAMAATWNLPLVKLAGQTIGRECRMFGVDVLLGPGVNGKRSPLGGRNFEYYSEDPFVSGKMASAFIQGLQSEGVGACLKHYALNDQETRRMSVDVHADERTMRELYLRPFEMAVKEAKPWMVMASYNKVNGQYASENQTLLNDILKKEFGFDGVAVSDWSAVKNKLASVQNGLDLQMPGPSGQIPMLLKAVENGELSEETIDEHIRRILALIERTSDRKALEEVDWENHHEFAVRLAEESIVLLKNDENVLPLKPGKLAVVGALAAHPNFAGNGSATLYPKTLDIPLEELHRYAEVRYAPGYCCGATNGTMLAEAAEAAQNADTVLIFMGSISSEGMDRTTLGFPQEQLALLDAVAAVNKNIIAVTMSGSAMAYREIAAKVKGILHAWISGEGCGKAIARILFGEVCPSGKLTETCPVSLQNTPAYSEFPGFKDDVYYREGILTGYRYYDTKEIPTQYPFGYGLSYTSFSYSNLRLSSKELTNGETLQVDVDVTNTGSYAGKEAVQIYVSDRASYLFRPQKELKGFTKVSLQPGESKTVRVTLDESAFSYYVPHLHRFAVESGTFEILVGASVEDIRLRDSVNFQSRDDVRAPLTEADLFMEFVEDNRYSAIAQQVLNELHMEPDNPFYQLVLGGSLYQLKDLLGFLGIDNTAGDKMISCMVNRTPVQER